MSKAKIFRVVVVLFICIWALYLRYKTLAERDLWGDEVYQLYQTIGSFKPIFKRTTYGDMTCFPGDYLLTYPLAQIFKTNKWGIMIPHIFFTILGFYVLYLVCQRYYKTVWGYMIAFGLVCFNGNLIFHSFEFRPYAVLPTLALLSFYCADRLVNDFDQLHRMNKITIGMVFVLIIWFHAFGIMLVVFPLFYFLLAIRTEVYFKKRIKSLLKYLALIFLLALPLWSWYAFGNPLEQSPQQRVESGKHPFQFIQNPFEYGFKRFFNRIFFYNLIAFKRFYFLLGALAFAFFIPFAGRLKQLGFYLTLIFLPILSILVASLISGYWFLERQYVFLSPLFAFFLGWLWDSSIQFYKEGLKTIKRPFGFSWMMGLILMTGCATGGVVGIIVSLFKA